MKLKKLNSVSALSILLCTTFFNSANAEMISNAKSESEYQTRQIVESHILETNEDVLFNLAKGNTNEKKLDENGNEVYTVVQLEEIVLTRTGENLSTYSETSFYKIEDKEQVNNRASITQDGWDKTNSAYLQSTINYTLSSDNMLKLNSCSGSVSKLNSGVSVQNLQVNVGAVYYLRPSQKVTLNYGTRTSFSYNAPSSWSSVPNVIGGNYGSTVGCSMSVKLGRSSSSTWTQIFTNNVGHFYNGSI